MTYINKLYLFKEGFLFTAIRRKVDGLGGTEKRMTVTCCPLLLFSFYFIYNVNFTTARWREYIYFYWF
jgi:hypothetical protein